MEFVGIIIGGLVLFVIISLVVKSPGRSLQIKFQKLGNMTGRRKQEIIAAAGPPSSISATGDGGQLLQWMATGYHIAIRFDANGMFRGITHEYIGR